jgi:hypothetical protein
VTGASGQIGPFYMPLLWRAAGLSALIWFAFHAAFAIIGALQLNLIAAGTVALACAAAVHVDLRRYSKHLFYANLGISPAHAVMIALISAASLEAILQVTLRVLGIS